MLAAMLLLPKLLLLCMLRLVIAIMLLLAFLMSLFLTLWNIVNFIPVISLSFRLMTRSAPPICVFLPIPVLLSLMLLLSWRTVLFTIFMSLWKNRIPFVATTLSAIPVRSFFVVLFLLKSKKMKRAKINPYLFSTVTFPEPWVAIRRPGVRLCLGEPVEVVTSVSRYCIPVYTLSIDHSISDICKSYAHYFHSIKGCNNPDILVSYLSIPRFVLAMRDVASFRALVLSAPIGISKG